MAVDLVVAEGATITLNDKPPANIAPALERVQLTTLKDLATSNFVGSPDNVETLLKAAKKVTESALSSRATFVPFVRVPGTTRPDLRRFGEFSALVSRLHPAEAWGFWRLTREIDPAKLADVTLTTKLDTVMPKAVIQKFNSFIIFRFQDITVQAHSTLSVGATVKTLYANNLKIMNTGRILALGNVLKISAFSIQGNL